MNFVPVNTVWPAYIVGLRCLCECVFLTCSMGDSSLWYWQISDVFDGVLSLVIRWAQWDLGEIFFNPLEKKYFSSKSLFFTTVTKCSSPAQRFVTSLFQEPRCQNSPHRVGCSHLHPISQPSCSPPSSTADLVLTSHCKWLCGKAAPGGNHIFLLLLNGIWQLKMRRSS